MAVVARRVGFPGGGDPGDLERVDVGSKLLRVVDVAVARGERENNERVRFGSEPPRAFPLVRRIVVVADRFDAVSDVVAGDLEAGESDHLKRPKARVDDDQIVRAFAANGVVIACMPTALKPAVVTCPPLRHTFQSTSNGIR